MPGDVITRKSVADEEGADLSMAQDQKLEFVFKFYRPSWPIV